MHARASLATAIAIAFLSFLGCTHGSGSVAESASTATAAPAAPAPASRAQMGTMMGDSAMIMLDGFAALKPAIRRWCGGRARRIYIGGTTMFIGNPTLTLASAGPVTVAARSTVGAMLGVPIEVKPGQKGAVLNWDAAPADAKP